MPASDIAKKYSLMKYGSAKEIKEASVEIANKFIALISDQQSSWYQLFDAAKKNGEHVIACAPGFRNVESASNSLIEKAIKMINLKLAEMNLPTIIVIKLTRLESNRQNYATLSKEERSSLPTTTDHIVPGKELFQHRVNLIFGDDIKITGATAEGTKNKSLSASALSFSEMYWVTIAPEAIEMMPKIEDFINKQAISLKLDETIEYILNQEDFVPVQRLLRLILSTNNRNELSEFINSKVTDNSLLKLWIGALNNEYHNDPQYSPSVEIMTNIVKSKGLDQNLDLISSNII